MHACGHDVHMANLVGVAKVLWQIRSELHGKVLLIFQPGEELLPGGALEIIRSEVFQKNLPDAMLGLHILPELKAGVVGFRPGPYMASGDEVYITVKGKGGHAALPHTLIDPVLIASHIVVGLQQVVSRKAPSNIPTVLSFGKITGRGANNVIPNDVEIEGTFRTMDEEWRSRAHTEIKNIAIGIAKGMGADCIVDIRKGYPALTNDMELTQLASQLAISYLDKQSVIELPLRMTTDDFAHYANEIPSVYFRVGSGYDNVEVSNLHSSKLNVNEYVLEHSIGLSAWLIYNFLNKQQSIRTLRE
jgi:amidohydrolase